MDRVDQPAEGDGPQSRTESDEDGGSEQDGVRPPVAAEELAQPSEETSSLRIIGAATHEVLPARSHERSDSSRSWPRTSQSVWTVFIHGRLDVVDHGA